ncbi:MAG: hypothetical protein II187_08470, partial [Treponema sp.]|nr:hypothetical protein [Treponema sp.]
HGNQFLRGMSPRPVKLGEGRFFNVKKSAYFRSEGLPSPKTPPFTGTVRGCAPWKPCFFKFTSKIDFRVKKLLLDKFTLHRYTAGNAQ